ncbi:MAG TPA: hypothetical protein VHY09_04430 [Candidatus Methylacidiphilales bacterium]|jgi:hypothetical protein|nr:hypothetical protein [Candidatus Methylacidiphilales bacterium]
MSCNYETASCPGRSLFRLVVFLLLAAFLLSSYKEIFRYIRISTM